MYVGLDVGGTNLKGARVSEDGVVLASLHEPIVRDSGERFLEQVERAVGRLAEQGQPVAVGIGLPAIVDGTARALGQVLGGLLNTLNLERVVIGGGVAAAGEFLLERIVRETRARCWPQVFSDCSFRLAELGGDAGVVGAVRVAMLGSVRGG